MITTTFKKVLVVFPHPDDESLSCGGTMYDFHRNGVQVDLLVLTKGERGIEGAFLTESLKPIRTKELQASAKYLHVNSVQQHDLGDGKLDHKKTEVSKIIDNALRQQYDLVITYDESGLYGHPDHMCVSEITTLLINTKYPTTTLWYISRPDSQFNQMKLPTHMAKDSSFIKKRRSPDIHCNISFRGMLAKIMSLESHHSQHFAFSKNKPKIAPIWLVAAVQTVEYFAIAHQGELS